MYYFWAWLRTTDGLGSAEREGFEVSFAVPSGNFGNILSGFFARGMGLPIRRLVLAAYQHASVHIGAPESRAGTKSSPATYDYAVTDLASAPVGGCNI